jgi:hypothetical protein
MSFELWSWSCRGRAARRLACGVLVCLAVPVGAGSAAAAATWSIVPSPNPSGYGPNLLAVSTDAASDAWTVGVVFNPSNSTYQTVSEHWDGTAWSVVGTPNPLTNSWLTGVAALSPTNAWAVGFASSGGWVTNRTLIAHWNGTSWSTVPSPNPSSFSENDLWATWAASPSDVWAVGDYLPGGGVEKPLAEHWNGTSWAVVPTPNAGHYANFHRVFGSSSTDVWAVGTAEDRPAGVSGPLTEHWNGVKWSIVPAPTLGETYLRGGWATSPSDAWIVGEWDGAGPNYTAHSLVYHWNGTTWTSVSSAPGTELWGVRAQTPTDAWIAGIKSGAGFSATLIEHWDGVSWTVVPSPNKTMAPGAINELNAVTMLPSGLVWAVGDFTGGNGGTLIEQTLQG